MTPRIALCATLFAAVATLAPSQAHADEFVTCESRNERYTTCSISRASYVTLDRQLSSASCRQGRTWDYNRNQIWVDDGCRATFRVHDFGYANSHGNHGGNNHDRNVAAGVLVGAALLGAIAHNANKHEERYDDRYQGARHASYVPNWMIGTFTGYNAIHGIEVTLTINADGRVSARTSNGQSINGWINNGELYAGGEVFTIRQSREGFVTSQVGDSYNEVRYQRSR